MAEPFLLVALRFIQGEPGMHLWDGSRKPRSTTRQQPLILLLVAALLAGQEASGQEFVRRTQEVPLSRRGDIAGSRRASRRRWGRRRGPARLRSVRGMRAPSIGRRAPDRPSRGA